MINKQHSLYQEDLQHIISTSGIEVLHGKRILITGATGLIGIELIDALMLLKDVDVIAVGRSRVRALCRLGEYFDNPRFIFLEQDVCYPFPDLSVDYIIPCASNTHPLAYSQFPVETIMTNVLGTRNALELARKCDATVLYPSTVEIYGNNTKGDSIKEELTGDLSLSSARSCYTESKRVCEAMCQSYISEYGLTIKIVRLSRVFGPTMLENDSKASSQFIKCAINGENICLKSDGQQKYSYTYVSDAVAAMLFVLINGDNGVSYNVSNPRSDIRLIEFAQICATLANTEIVYIHPSEKERNGYSIATNAVLDNTRLKKLGYLPHYDIKDSIYRTIELLKK